VIGGLNRQARRRPASADLRQVTQLPALDIGPILSVDLGWLSNLELG